MYHEIISKTTKPPDLQLVYKKNICFTKQQKKNTLKTLENYGVNVNQFIRLAVKEKIQRDWKEIKEEKEKK